MFSEIYFQGLSGENNDFFSKIYFIFLFLRRKALLLMLRERFRYSSCCYSAFVRRKTSICWLYRLSLAHNNLVQTQGVHRHREILIYTIFILLPVWWKHSDICTYYDWHVCIIYTTVSTVFFLSNDKFTNYYMLPWSINTAEA